MTNDLADALSTYADLLEAQARDIGPVSDSTPAAGMQATLVSVAAELRELVEKAGIDD